MFGKKKFKNLSGGKKVRIFLRSAGFFAKNRPIFEIFEKNFRNYLDLIWLQKSDIKSFFVTSHMTPPELFFTFPRFLGLKFENVISHQRNGRDQRYLVHKLGSYKGFKWWHFYSPTKFRWNRICAIDRVPDCKRNVVVQPTSRDYSDWSLTCLPFDWRWPC